MAFGLAVLLTGDGLGIFVIGIPGSVILYESLITIRQIP